MSNSVISSRQNPRVKEACALRNRQQRDRTGLTLVDGVRESARALAAGAKMACVFHCPALLRLPEAKQVVNQLADAGAELLEVTPDVFEKLAYGDRLEGLVSIVAANHLLLTDLNLPERPLIALIERVEKPGNLGAILRTADGAGVDGVIVADPVIDLFNPNTIRASVASVFRPNVVVATAEQSLAWLRSTGLAIWTARPHTNKPYYETDFTQPGAIVLGNEAEGLSKIWNADDMTPVALPMRGIADSLNVSATAAVLFYEAHRQRHSGS